MTTLHDQAIADLAAMLDDREFATLTSINGAAPVPCIVDHELKGTRFEGVREWDCTLYVRTSDLAEAVPGQRFQLDDRSAVVVDADEIHGLQVVHLRWYES